MSEQPLDPLRRLQAELELERARDGTWVSRADEHRQLRQEYLERQKRLRERNPDSPDLAEPPWPPNASLTLEDRGRLFVEWAVEEIEPGLRDDLGGVRAQLEVLRDVWLAKHDDPLEELAWLELFHNGIFLDVVARTVVAIWAVRLGSV